MLFNLNKRQRIIITSALVTLGLLSGLFYTRLLIDVTLRFEFILGLGLLAFILSFWALWPGAKFEGSFSGLNKTKAIVLLILPAFYTLAVASFYYVLPLRWFTKLPMGLFFGLSFYLLLLAQNVFNVAAIRTIPLYRAASTAGFVFTVFTALCFYSVIGALTSSPGNLLPFYSGALLISLVSFPLILQILWATKMENYISALILAQSFVLTLLIGELALALSFWPTAVGSKSFAIASVLASVMYVLIGIITHHLRERLGGREVVEYLLFGMVVWVTAILVTLFA